jgi:hypothetical protein
MPESGMVTSISGNSVVSPATGALTIQSSPRREKSVAAMLAGSRMT